MRIIKAASKMLGETDDEHLFRAAYVMKSARKLVARLVDPFESAKAVDEEVSRTIKGTRRSPRYAGVTGVGGR